MSPGPMGTTEKNARQRWWWLARFSVGAVLIGVLVARLDVGSMARFLARADLVLVSVTLLTVAADRSLMAGRWISLLEGLGIRAPRQRVIKIFFVSTFFGSFLPTGIGGEAVRAVSFSRLTSKGVESVASVVMDRLMGMLSMLLLGLLALAFSYRMYPHPALLVTVLGLSVAVVAGLGLALSPSFHGRVKSFVTRRSAVSPPAVPESGEAPALGGWRGSVARSIEALGRYRNRLGVLAAVLAMSVGVQILRILQAFLLSEAMALQTSLIYFFCFVPVILLITMLPISVSGLGTTNVAYVVLFGGVGMDPEGAFVLSVLILALGVAGNLPGGVIYALEGFGASEALPGMTAKPAKEDPRHENLERAGLVESDR